MQIFYLISIIIGVSAQNILKKSYTEKNNGKGVYFFSAATSLSAILFFVISAIAMKGTLEWNVKMLPYAILFALSYVIVTIFSVIAVSTGSLSITSLIISYSLMLPTFYGIFFLKDTISVGLIPGIILLFVSLFLINKKDKGAIFSTKWIVSVLLAFLGNGLCSVVQKMQQVKMDGLYKDEFMILSLAMVFIVTTVLVVIKEKNEFSLCAKNGWHLSMICGLMNGMVNLFVMVLSAVMSVSLMFPLISSGGIIVTYIVSKFFYKESLTKIQLFGFVMGIISVVLLNI